MASLRGYTGAYMPIVAPAGPRPPLKWAGGKRWQIPHLRTLWTPHAHRRLVEPFCGGLAVALGLAPPRALLNDANPHLINFYRWLQRGLRTDMPMENDEGMFYRHRERFNALLSCHESDSEEAAALFYYLNRTGYNGLCRFNRQGVFNVPFGRYTRIPYTRDFSKYGKVFSEWTFVSGDVEAVPIEPGDFVYADPPYDVEFTQYAKDGFTWSDQERTAVLLARHEGPVVLVNQATRRVEALYKELGYRVRFLEGPRRINCTGNRSPAREIIGTRNV
jgi:DNA adenine methylase